ncbi:MAG: hypothetical protein WCI18_15580 [Pseudomonadota bacterium]
MKSNQFRKYLMEKKSAEASKKQQDDGLDDYFRESQFRIQRPSTNTHNPRQSTKIGEDHGQEISKTYLKAAVKAQILSNNVPIVSQAFVSKFEQNQSIEESLRQIEEIREKRRSTVPPQQSTALRSVSTSKEYSSGVGSDARFPAKIDKTEKYLSIEEPERQSEGNREKLRASHTEVPNSGIDLNTRKDSIKSKQIHHDNAATVTGADSKFEANSGLNVHISASDSEELITHPSKQSIPEKRSERRENSFEQQQLASNDSGTKRSILNQPSLLLEVADDDQPSFGVEKKTPSFLENNVNVGDITKLFRTASTIQKTSPHLRSSLSCSPLSKLKTLHEAGSKIEDIQTVANDCFQSLFSADSETNAVPKEQYPDRPSVSFMDNKEVELKKRLMASSRHSRRSSLSTVPQIVVPQAESKGKTILDTLFEALPFQSIVSVNGESVDGLSGSHMILASNSSPFPVKQSRERRPSNLKTPLVNVGRNIHSRGASTSSLYTSSIIFEAHVSDRAVPIREEDEPDIGRIKKASEVSHPINAKETPDQFDIYMSEAEYSLKEVAALQNSNWDTLSHSTIKDFDYNSKEGPILNIQAAENDIGWDQYSKKTLNLLRKKALRIKKLKAVSLEREKMKGTL